MRNEWLKKILLLLNQPYKPLLTEDISTSDLKELKPFISKSGKYSVNDKISNQSCIDSGFLLTIYDNTKKNVFLNEFE